MKLKPIARALALAIALLAPAFAIPPSTPPLSDAIVTLTSSPSISRGMSHGTVEYILGKPDERLSSDVWVYWNFKAKGVPVSDGVDTLIVGFTDDRVTLIRLSKSGPVRAFIAQQKAKSLDSSRATQ